MILSDYRAAISLDAPWSPDRSSVRGDDPARVLTWLRRDVPDPRLAHPEPLVEIDARLTVRPPLPVPPDQAAALDRILAERSAQAPRIRPTDLPTVAQALPGSRYAARDQVSLWRGDITTLAARAVVNAANSALLGCFQPFHACIDNAIHRIAGPMLRADCARIMAIQGEEEPTGGARITRAYHLPADYVLHTVGPIIRDRPGARDREALAGCYRSCLDLAAETGRIKTLAFCAISTGVFRYPKVEAAAIALATVAEWLGANPGLMSRVVFNVFSEEDARIYRAALREAA